MAENREGKNYTIKFKKKGSKQFESSRANYYKNTTSEFKKVSLIKYYLSPN